MSDRFEVLHYPGNVTGADKAQPGALLGGDETGRPYEVIDAEYMPGDDFTAAHLTYASTDTLRAHLASLPAVFSGGAR
jgi:hypothetical protein